MVKENVPKWMALGCISFLMQYHFIKSEPEDYYYKLDFRYVSDMDSYVEIFERAVWEYIGKMFLWYYFRKAATENEAQDIYSDNHSKLERNNNILRVLYAVLLLNILPLVIHMLNSLIGSTYFPRIILINFFLAVLIGYGIYKIKKKMHP